MTLGRCVEFLWVPFGASEEVVRDVCYDFGCAAPFGCARLSPEGQTEGHGEEGDAFV